MNSERRPATRLPEDPAYWEDLAARSVDAAFRSSAAPDASSLAHARDGAFDALAQTRDGAFDSLAHARDGAFDAWWRTMSDAAFLLAASAVLAVFGGSLLLEERAPGAAMERHALTGALAPDDPLLASLLDAPDAPPPSALLRLVVLRQEER